MASVSGAARHAAAPGLLSQRWLAPGILPKRKKERIVKAKSVTVVALAALVSSIAIAGPAAAHNRDHKAPLEAGTPTTLVGGLVSPLSLAVDRRGRSFVSQNFAGILTSVTRKGVSAELTTAPGLWIEAVSVRRGTVYFAENAPDLSATALLSVPAAGGTPTRIADLHAYEAQYNPDQTNVYGFVDLPQECADQFDPAAAPFLAPHYNGLIDSHPYASLPLRDAVYVADAGANAILRVAYDGTVTTAAVLPSRDPVALDTATLERFGFPSCAEGVGYRFEAVPTDVELGADGWLYVTSLPGGPEDASLGARGAVYRADPETGDVELVASGFTGATGLAVSPRTGSIYVAELFGGTDGSGQISVIDPGSTTPRPLIALPSPAAIEVHRGNLYVTTNVLPGAPTVPPAGTITVVPLVRGGHGDMAEDSTAEAGAKTAE